MKSRKTDLSMLAMAGCLIFGLVLFAAMQRIEAAPRGNAAAAQAEASRVAVDADDIGGVVTSSKGPEAGVWVIAETADFQTKLRKIVVTDDHGRFLLPQLPKANYKVWVRGYGLVDSTPVNAALGKTLALTAVVAPNARAAAQFYPPNYWLSMLKIPPKSAFPMPAASGGGKPDSHAGRLDRHHKVRLPGLPPAGGQNHARNAAESWHVSFRHGGLEAADTVGPSRRGDDRPHE